MLYKIRTDSVESGFFLGPNQLLCWLKESKGARLYNVSESNAYDELKANPVKEIDWEQNKKYTKFIIKNTTYVGGDNGKKNETFEWPSDEYLEKIGKEDIQNIRNYQITKINWIPEITGSDKDNLLVSWTWENNLNDKSEVFFTPKKMNGHNVIDLAGRQLGKITSKHSGSEADYFRLYDRDDNMLAQMSNNYEESRNDEYRLIIP